jgi:hypothetical protein
MVICDDIRVTERLEKTDLWKCERMVACVKGELYLAEGLVKV